MFGLPKAWMIGIAAGLGLALLGVTYFLYSELQERTQEVERLTGDLLVAKDALVASERLAANRKQEIATLSAILSDRQEMRRWQERQFAQFNDRLEILKNEQPTAPLDCNVLNAAMLDAVHRILLDAAASARRSDSGRGDGAARGDAARVRDPGPSE